MVIFYRRSSSSTEGCLEFSRTVSIVHVMLNQGPEGQRPGYLQAVKAARPELQVNVKVVFLPIIFVWLVSCKFFGFDTVIITLVLLFAPFDSIMYLHVPV